MRTFLLSCTQTMWGRISHACMDTCVFRFIKKLSHWMLRTNAQSRCCISVTVDRAVAKWLKPKPQVHGRFTMHLKCVLKYNFNTYNIRLSSDFNCSYMHLRVTFVKGLNELTFQSLRRQSARVCFCRIAHAPSPKQASTLQATHLTVGLHKMCSIIPQNIFKSEEQTLLPRGLSFTRENK
jgi:hypothetical protein